MFKNQSDVNGAPTRQNGDHGSAMSLTVGVWLCCLPLVFLVVAPFFGWKAAGVVSLGLFVVLFVICFGICTTKFYREGGERHV